MRVSDDCRGILGTCKRVSDRFRDVFRSNGLKIVSGDSMDSLRGVVRDRGGLQKRLVGFNGNFKAFQVISGQLLHKFGTSCGFRAVVVHPGTEAHLNPLQHIWNSPETCIPEDP